MNENKRKKVVAIVLAIFVVIIFTGVTVFLLRNSIFAFFAPKTYTLSCLGKTVEKIEEEMEIIEDNLSFDEIDFDEDTTFSFWKYTDSENEKKKGDLSFDLSVSKKNKRLEFAYDNTKAKYIKDFFLYIDNEEIGVNLADFSDDYWVNNAKTAIFDYNNSSLRTILNANKIKREYDLSFKKDVGEEIEDKIEKKEVISGSLKSLKFEKKEKNGRSQYNMYFSQTKEEMINFLSVILPGFENYFDVTDTDIIFSLKDGAVRGVSVAFSKKHSFDLQFSLQKEFLSEFSFSFFINDNDKKNEISFTSKGNRFDKKEFTDESELAFISSLGNKIYLKNTFSLDNKDIKGNYIYGVNEEKTTYQYVGEFDCSDGIFLDLSNVKSVDSNSQIGFYLENNFNNVIRKVENKKEILSLNHDELISYLKKTGGEKIVEIFK